MHASIFALAIGFALHACVGVNFTQDGQIYKNCRFPCMWVTSSAKKLYLLSLSLCMGPLNLQTNAQIIRPLLPVLDTVKMWYNI